MHEKYGPVYRVWMGDFYTIVINDIELIKKIFIQHSDIFINHPDTPTNRHYSNNYNGLIFTRDMDKWTTRRRILVSSLQKIKMKNVYSQLDVFVNQLLGSMKQHSDLDGGDQTIFYPRVHIQQFTMNIILQMIMNKKVQVEQEEGLKNFYDMINLAFIDLGNSKLSDWVYILQPFLSVYYKVKTDSLVPNVIKNQFLRKEYDEHLNSFSDEYKENPRDFIDVLINQLQESDQQEKAQVCLNICLDLIFAGVETVSGVLDWSFVYLVNNPMIQQIAYKELVDVVGKDRNVKLSDRNSTPYLNAFIKEVCRIRVVGPLGVPRTCSEDIKIDGYLFPKDAQIIPNLYGIALNSNYWENPLEFDPSRFLKQQNNGFNIFSWGPRNCPGQQLANDELYLAIGNIIKSFEVSSIDGNPIDDTGVFALSLYPKPFPVNLKSR
ncbi:hypothetical protein CYY_006122 [Polysphondylium violaceum]|uniref:Cytochrome P450 family protein n=1 Tax=Polysphondylium violaceum TaxID=133409 RepID=A0A8J4PR16_9MYCE|nr:hypothetical protein CYY_006122 [Polysphondylium violaceum]